MATTTTNKALPKPALNADIDTWGGFLNAALDLIDGLFHLGGGLRVAQGGTGATTAGDARINLGLGNSATRAVGTTAGTVADGEVTNSSLLLIAGAVGGKQAQVTYGTAAPGALPVGSLYGKHD